MLTSQHGLFGIAQYVWGFHSEKRLQGVSPPAGVEVLVGPSLYISTSPTEEPYRDSGK